MGGITDEERGLCSVPKGIDAPDVREQMIQRMRRVIGTYDPVHAIIANQFGEDVNNGRSPREMLAGRRSFDDDNDRLLYLELTIQRELGPTANPEDVAAAMADYEIARIKTEAAMAIPGPPLVSPYVPGGTSQQIALRERGLEWARAAADNERSEYEEFLEEMSRQADEDKQRVASSYTYGAAAPSGGLYDQFIGAPIMGAVDEVKEQAPTIVSLLLDFTPIVGQLKAVAEAIYGKDLITGRELATWERGLGALLAIVPEARGIFRAGRTGLRTLATITRESSLSADEAYRVMKAASKLTEEDVIAARRMVNGRPADPAAAEKVAGTIAEMTASPSRGYRAAAGVIDDGRSLSRSVASSPIDLAAKAPGKVVKATTTAPAIVSSLERAGVSTEAVAALERAGVTITKDAARVLSDPKVGAFVNLFHECSGFEEVVKDVIKPGTKRKGGSLVIEYVLDPANKIKPSTAKFELASGITKGKVRDSAARLTDLVITDGNRTINYEFKAYTRAALLASLDSPSKLRQLLKDVAMFGRKNMRWVYDSREVSRALVYEKFTQVIKSDALLSKEFGTGEELKKALDELIVMYP